MIFALWDTGGKFAACLEGCMMLLEQKNRFEFIDGLRGIAALSVVFFHLNLAIHNHGDAFPYYLAQLFSLGYLGIQIFFVLSGFVIAYSLRDAHMDLSFLTRFFVRRSFRLDPPYWVIVGLTLLLAGIASLTFKSGVEFPFDALQIFYNLIYLPDLMQEPLIVPVAWTLCIEFQFYLTFALLILMVQGTEMKLAYSLLMWTGLSLFSILQNTPWGILPLNPVTFIPHWYSFFLGCATCWAMLGKIDKKFLWSNYLIIAICSFWTPTPHALVSVGTALLIYMVFQMGWLNSLLQEWFFQYTGRISYSLYLIHWPVGMKLIDIGYKIAGAKMDHPFSIGLMFAGSLFLTILAADLFYRIVERPSHNFSRSFYTKKKLLQDF